MRDSIDLSGTLLAKGSPFFSIGREEDESWLGVRTSILDASYPYSVPA